MSKNKKKKRLLDSRFYRVYFAVVTIALTLILVFTVWLMSYLRDLESAEPIYVARDVAALFEKGDYENLYRMDGSAEAISGGDRDFYIENLNQITAGRTVDWLSCCSASRMIAERSGSLTSTGITVMEGRQ